jgi:hypothetical protein
MNDLFLERKMFGIYKEEIETGTRERRNENIYP